VEIVAQKTIVQLIDDLDGGEATERVSFGLDGVEYTIDLSEDNAEKLRDGLSAFVEKARRLGGRKQRGTGTASNAGAKSVSNKEQNQAIRVWARGQGEKISDRGRIPAEVVERFHAVHAV
jgi:hypothetical protein